MKNRTLVASLALTALCTVGAHGMQAPPKGGGTGSPSLPAIETLRGYQSARLAVPTGIPERVDIVVPIDGRNETLRLFRTSLRSPKAKMYLDRGNGALEESPLPPHRTYRGTVASNGAGVSASVIDGKLWAMIDLPEELGGTRFVQPMSDFVQGRAANEHVVFRHTDSVNAGGHMCGNDGARLALPEWMGGAPNDPAANPPEGSVANAEGGVAGTTPFIAEIAFDADYEFFQKNASSAANTVNDIELVMNNVSFVYDRDVNISYEYAAFVVRTTAADPYTSTDMVTLLCEFRTKWNTTPENQIFRDVAQLYTGKTINGSVIGLAWLGVLCNQSGNDCGGIGNLAYNSVESRFTTNLDFRTALSAHELGHNWQAQHCDSTNPCNIMCSAVNACQGITGSNLKFAATEQSQITAYRNAVSCDPALPAPITLPFSDDFEVASINASKWLYNKGGAISTAATNEPSPTRSLNLDAVGNLEYGDDEIRSNYMLLGGITATVTLSYATEAIGVESGEQLIVEYLNSALDWVAINTITSDGVSQANFQNWSHTLPAAAKHNKFRVRFRTAVDAADDDWYIDNVAVSLPTPPANDQCNSATLVSNGIYSFDTSFATNSDFDLPASCNEGNGVAANNDVWFLYIPTCTGNLAVSTCGLAGFDTRIAAYASSCPPSGALLACSDNGAGCPSGSSSMTVSVTQNLPVYIRVGGATGGGAGSISLSCTPVQAPCPADLDNDRIVSASDIAILLNSWGGTGGDLDGNGTTNGADLTILLNAWGACP
ncbi:MAG: M12 family metallo-peptidase [Planctomycetota bacterium]